jgi:hypothetical protein
LKEVSEDFYSCVGLFCDVTVANPVPRVMTLFALNSPDAPMEAVWNLMKHPRSWVRSVCFNSLIEAVDAAASKGKQHILDFETIYRLILTLSNHANDPVSLCCGDSTGFTNTYFNYEAALGLLCSVSLN